MYFDGKNFMSNIQSWYENTKHWITYGLDQPKDKQIDHYSLAKEWSGWKINTATDFILKPLVGIIVLVVSIAVTLWIIFKVVFMLAFAPFWIFFSVTNNIRFGDREIKIQ